MMLVLNKHIWLCWHAEQKQIISISHREPACYNPLIQPRTRRVSNLVAFHWTSALFSGLLGLSSAALTAAPSGSSSSSSSSVCDLLLWHSLEQEPARQNIYLKKIYIFMYIKHTGLGGGKKSCQVCCAELHVKAPDILDLSRRENMQTTA